MIADAEQVGTVTAPGPEMSELQAVSKIHHLRVAKFQRIVAELGSGDAIVDVPFPEDVSSAVPLERLESLAELHYRGRILPTIEAIRNVLILFPVLFTWLSLSLASAAFQMNIETLPSEIGVAPVSFQQLWERGFDIPVVDWGPIKNIPLVISSSSGSGWRWFTFSFVAGADAMIILGIVGLQVWGHSLHRSVRQRQEIVVRYVDEELQRIRVSFSRHHVMGAERRAEAAQRAVVESLSAFSQGAVSTLEAISTGSSRFAEMLSRREREEQALEGATKELLASAQAFRGFGEQAIRLFEEQARLVGLTDRTLSGLLGEQAKGREALEHVSGRVEAAAGTMVGVSSALKEVVIATETSNISFNDATIKMANIAVSLRNSLDATEQSRNSIVSAASRHVEAASVVREALERTLSQSSETMTAFRMSIDAQTDTGRRSNQLIDELSDLTGRASSELAQHFETTSATLATVSRDISDNLDTAAGRIGGAASSFEQFANGFTLLNTVVQELSETVHQLTNLVGQERGSEKASVLTTNLIGSNTSSSDRTPAQSTEAEPENVTSRDTGSGRSDRPERDRGRWWLLGR